MLAALLVGCTGELPAYGEVIVFVDTDLGVPTEVSRLRVDSYTHDGRWFDSRGISLSSASDWPASFSVVAPTEDADAEVLIRLRAYPEGRTRDRYGERFREPMTYEEPLSPDSAAAMCNQASELPLDEGRWVRRGSTVFDVTDGCLPDGEALTAGSVALHVDVPAAGAYWFAITDSYPPPSLAFNHATLSVRRGCRDATTELACLPGLSLEGIPVTNQGTFPPVPLESGPHTFVISGAYGSGAADLLVGWSTVVKLNSGFDDPYEPPFQSGKPPTTDSPTIGAGYFVEPIPESAVDRLVRLRLRHGEVTTTRVVLRGACMGTQADVLGGAAAARTCIDEDGVLESVPLGQASDGDADGVSLVGTFGQGEPCADEAGISDVVCVAGQASLLGYPEGAGRAELATAPERLAVTERFWIDRHEVTVSRFRHALAAGLGTTLPRSRQEDPSCSWTARSSGWEAHPVNCVSWRTARDFCRFTGGDLPTEAQWELVAQTAGRPLPTVFPWGSYFPECACDSDGDPTCHAGGLATLDGLCAGKGPLGSPTFAVDTFADAHGDVSVGLGVVGLGGNVSEWVKDAFFPYDHRCWHGSRIVERKCFEEDPPLRAVRGGSFQSDLGEATARFARLPIALDADVGFRCVYAEEP